MKTLTEILDRQKIKGWIRYCWHVKGHEADIKEYADFLAHFRDFQPFHLN